MLAQMRKKIEAQKTAPEAARSLIGSIEEEAAQHARELLATRAHLSSLKAKMAADDAKYAQPPCADAESLGGSRAEPSRELAYLRADAALLKAENALASAKTAAKDAKKAPAKKDETAQKQRDEAKKAWDNSARGLGRRERPVTPRSVPSIRRRARAGDSPWCAGLCRNATRWRGAWLSTMSGCDTSAGRWLRPSSISDSTASRRPIPD